MRWPKQKIFHYEPNLNNIALPRNPTTGSRPKRGSLLAGMENFSGQRPGKSVHVKMGISCTGVGVWRRTEGRRGREGRGILA